MIVNRELRLAELEQLNIELMDSLELCMLATKEFCEKNNIPFYDEKMLASIKKINSLIDEISPMPYMALSKRKVTDRYGTDETNGEVTEPRFRLYIGEGVVGKATDACYMLLLALLAFCSTTSLQYAVEPELKKQPLAKPFR